MARCPPCCFLANDVGGNAGFQWFRLSLKGFYIWQIIGDGGLERVALKFAA